MGREWMSTKRRVKKFRDTLKLDSIFRNRSTKRELVPWELARYPAAFYSYPKSVQIIGTCRWLTLLITELSHLNLFKKLHKCYWKNKSWHGNWWSYLNIIQSYCTGKFTKIQKHICECLMIILRVLCDRFLPKYSPSSSCFSISSSSCLVSSSIFLSASVGPCKK